MNDDYIDCALHDAIKADAKKAGGLGLAMLAVSSFLAKKKAEAEALTDDAVVQEERVRGIVAGDAQIALGKMSENLLAALRPTNDILREMSDLLGDRVWDMIRDPDDDDHDDCEVF